MTVGRYRHAYNLRDQISHAVSSAFRVERLEITDKHKRRLFGPLKKVSFEIKRGEAPGVIGANGAGKSTLLKILSRITELNFRHSGDSGPRWDHFLEVGTGFNEVLTGGRTSISTARFTA